LKYHCGQEAVPQLLNCDLQAVERSGGAEMKGDPLQMEGFVCHTEGRSSPDNFARRALASLLGSTADSGMTMDDIANIIKRMRYIQAID
jgi:hypothetical protein